MMTKVTKTAVNDLDGDQDAWLRWQWCRILLPYVGIPLAVLSFYWWGWSWLDFVIMSVGIIASGIGFSVGLHRHFTHNSFKAKPFVRKTLGVLGLMASHLTIKEYVATHLCHHATADTERDPHSPHFSDVNGSPSLLSGLMHSHTSWLLRKDLNIVDKVKRYGTSLEADELVINLDRYHKQIMLLSLLVPALLGGLISGTWQGAVSAFIWGGLLRMLVVDNVEGFGRGLSHYIGERPFASRDKSTNSAYAYLAMGEWHNNHHAFPACAKHGLERWQLDSGYQVICLLEALGLAWDVNRIEAVQIQKKKDFLKSMQINKSS